MSKTSLPSLLRSCVACGFLFSASAGAEEKYNVLCAPALMDYEVKAARESGLQCPKQAIKCSEEQTVERKVLSLAAGGDINMTVPYYFLKMDDSVVEALKAKKKMSRIAGDNFRCGVFKQ